jgi:transcription initiation factor TFIIE subunit beta
MRLDDLAIRTQTPIDTDKVLLEKFRTHDRVEFDPKTNLYSFKVSLPYGSSPAFGS